MRFKNVANYLARQNGVFPNSTGNAFCYSPRNIMLKKIVLYGIAVRCFSDLMRGGYLPHSVILKPPEGELGSLSRLFESKFLQ